MMPLEINYTAALEDSSSPSIVNPALKSNYVMFSPSGIINYSYAHVSTPSICLPSVSLASVSVRIRISAVAEKKVHVEYVCVCVCCWGRGGGPPGTQEL